MDSTDRLIRALYTLSVETEWHRYRGQALEQACATLGAATAAWHTHVAGDDGQGEYTAFPESAPPPREALRAAGNAPETVLTGAQLPPGCKQGIVLRHSHFETRLVSQVLYGFAAGQKMPPVEALRQITTHLVEAGAVALRQYISRDEKLSSMGRSSRGSAALVDAQGIVYSASSQFHDLLGGGGSAIEKLPFGLPEEAFVGRGVFSRNSLHFRASPAGGGKLYVLHARRGLPLDELSPREQEIARALSAGKTFKTVARQCGIAVSTVANHASRIYRKLGIYRREELVELIRTPSKAVAR